MKTHVVSVFPVQGVDAYARITLTAYEDTALLPVAPCFTSLAQVLKTVKLLGLEGVPGIMSDLDKGVTLQVSVTEHEALVITPAAFSGRV